MSLPLKVLAEVIDSVMAPFELGPCDMTVSTLQAHDSSNPTSRRGRRDRSGLFRRNLGGTATLMCRFSASFRPGSPVDQEDIGPDFEGQRDRRTQRRPPRPAQHPHPRQKAFAAVRSCRSRPTACVPPTHVHIKSTPIARLEKDQEKDHGTQYQPPP
jgi:hypothetical protein